MSRNAFVDRRVRAVTAARTRVVVAAWLAVAATGLAETAAADDGPAPDADRVPAQQGHADAAQFEAFVREVGIDMTSVPAEVRREWASAPSLIIDDCGIPGTHAGHSHDGDRGDQAVMDSGASERASSPKKEKAHETDDKYVNRQR